MPDHESSPFRFAVSTPLRWVDVDSEGVVNNAVYLSLMELARWRYFRDLGLLRSGRVPFVLAEATVKFLRPGRAEMIESGVETAARVSHLGRTSFGMAFEVRASGTVLSTGTAALVFVNGELRPVVIDDETRARLREFEDL